MFHRRKTYRFGTAWGWENDERILIFEWTIPLNKPTVSKVKSTGGSCQRLSAPMCMYRRAPKGGCSPAEHDGGGNNSEKGRPPDSNQCRNFRGEAVGTMLNTSLVQQHKDPHGQNRKTSLHSKLKTKLLLNQCFNVAECWHWASL